MRLLYTTSDGNLRWTNDIIRSEDIPPYAILSHTWGEQEVVFDDLKSLHSVEDIDTKKEEGWNKIHFCAQQAKRDGLGYFWVDTCCIDKANNTELSEAINSMFRWYQNADKCYVFLSDVEGKSSDGKGKSSSRWKAAFRASRWFSRGWTLQELLAPRSVEFFSKDGAPLGDKESLKQTIHEVTKIPIEALSGSDLSEFDIAERFSWAQNRQTTKEEDGAYCLLGIFGCHLPLIYGEGREGALKRLRKEMLEASEDFADASVNSAKTRSRSQEERLSKICSWLSAPDPSTNYHKAHKQRQAETGLWLLESEKFRKWKNDVASRLWLYGIPGCGKTILSSTVIEHLQQLCDDDIHKVTVYFYFNFNDAQKQDPELMLRSLLCQLLQRSVMISEGVDALFSSCENGQRQPSLRALLKVAPQVMQQFTHVYIVLDALDECTQRLELMNMLETMAGWQLDILHLLMTSRKERDIERSLESYVEEDDTICLQRDVVDEDILRYVQQRLRDDKGVAKWNKDADIAQEIEIALMRGARGMFRWAVCQLDTLAKCRNLAMLRKSLATLPQTLDQTYDRILTAISEEDCAYAMRILQWLTFSARPLSVEEVAEVVAIDVARQPAFDRDEVLVDPLEALDICSSLVTIPMNEAEEGSMPGQRIITLAHYSVQEYLVSDRIKQGPAKRYSMQEVECHKAITKGSLEYLNQFQQPVSEELLKVSALAQYSARFWSSHFQKTGDEVEEVNRLAMSLFSIEDPAYLTWIRLYDPNCYWMEPELGLKSIATPLYYGSLLGLSTITKLLLDQGAVVNAQSGKHGNALQAASIRGHKAVVELLIKAGADVNAPGGDLGNALQAASAEGHKAVVELLIDAGAAVNAQGGVYGNALQAASAKGHEQIVRMLLSADAAVNMQGGCYNNALRAALVGANETTVRILLERGANVGLDARLKGAMHHALNNAWCAPSLVSMLQQYGAPLDTIDVDNMTPLHYCVKHGHEAIAKQLIDAGVPIDSRVRRQTWPSKFDKSNLLDQVDTMPPVSGSIAAGLTPLHFAALTGSITMTKFLLKHGADLNAVSEYGETPLHLTLRTTLFGTEYKDDWNDSYPKTEERLFDFLDWEKSIATLEISLKRNEVLDALLADPRTSLTVRDNEGESSLHCIRYGKPECTTLIQRLVSRGADPLCGNLSQQSPLHFASKAGDHASVRALLSMGAKVALTDERGLNALHYAAQNGNLQTIIAILETEEARAAKLIASKDKRGQNVLHHMLSEELVTQVEAVQWLLDQGADGSELDDSGTSPLARYMKNSKWGFDMEICRSLLAIKRNASFVDFDGQTLGHLYTTNRELRVDVLKTLNDYSVNLAKKDCDGRTVLHRAAIHGSLTKESLEFLVNVVGLQAEEEDTHGRTALQYAIDEAAKDLNPCGWDYKRWERTADILLSYHGYHTFSCSETRSIYVSPYYHEQDETHWVFTQYSKWNES